MSNFKHSLGGLIVDDIVCINLKVRKDRRVKFKREARKKKFPVRFSRAVKNVDNPTLGKWEAHINVWKNALRGKRTNNVLIFEDDAKILVSKLNIHIPPDKWDMIYLGGNIQRAISDDATDQSSNWKRVCCLMCHAYIVNRVTIRDLLSCSKQYLEKCKKNKEEIIPIDRWLCTEYHPTKLVYICIPDRVIQRDGFSDVKQKFVTFNQQLTARAFINNKTEGADQIDFDENALVELPKTPMETVNGKDSQNKDTLGYILKLPKISTEELPNVTLITPTHNNRSGFYFVIRNFYKLQYPKEKLTWIIADDSAEGKEVKSLIPGNDQRIKYVSCKMGKNSFLSVSKKINLCMNYVTNPNELIVHFYDDQYYPEMSVLSRVKVLMASHQKSPQIKCVGCTDFGVFDIVSNKSYQKYYPDANDNKTILYGPSLCYLREWWDERKFDESKYVMETFYFTKGRLHQTIEMPYQFVSINLVTNDPDATEADRYGKKGGTKEAKKMGNTFAKYNKDAQLDNFFDGWDKETQNFILLMKETIDE